MLAILGFFKIGFKDSLKELLLALLCAVVLSFYDGFFLSWYKYGLASFGGIFITIHNRELPFFLCTFD